MTYTACLTAKNRFRGTLALLSVGHMHSCNGSRCVGAVEFFYKVPPDDPRNYEVSVIDLLKSVEEVVSECTKLKED